jgi:hypothetical protein
MLPQTTSIWQHDSQPAASDEPGAVQFTDDPATVQEASAIALATMLETDPRLTTPKAIREASEKIGQQVRLYIRALRERYVQTGTRIWDASAVTRQ